MKNGIFVSGNTVGSRTTSPGSSWDSPPYNCLHLSPPASQSPTMSQTQHQPNAPIAYHQSVHLNSQDQGIDGRTQFPPVGEDHESSPDCSESFTPPSSPGLQNLESQRSSCPLMDEVDRG